MFTKLNCLSIKTWLILRNIDLKTSNWFTIVALLLKTFDIIKGKEEGGRSYQSRRCHQWEGQAQAARRGNTDEFHRPQVEHPGPAWLSQIILNAFRILTRNDYTCLLCMRIFQYSTSSTSFCILSNHKINTLIFYWYLLFE